MTSGEIAIAALAQLDMITMTRDWHKSPKIRKQIRLVINVANQAMKNTVCQSCGGNPNGEPTDPLTTQEEVNAKG